MTETDNVATYARIRPYNPAINEDKRLTARAQDGNKILNSNGDKTDTYNFTRVYDMKHGTMDLFETGMKPLLEYKILQGINSIFIVYGQSGSGKSFTLIGEKGHLGVLPLSLQYLLEQDCVERIDVSSIEAYGIKATKIGFYDLVTQLETKKKAPKKYDPYTTKDNSRLNAGNASILEITRDNCLQIITELQEVSHMAPTLKNPHSSRGHTVYFCRVKMKGLEDVYFICVDLAGSEGATALGTKDEFVTGLKLAMSKGKLKLSKKQMKGFEQMYKTRFYEAACINNGLTQLQSIFGELIKQKISKSQGLGLRKVLSSFINLKTAYAILFTLSASANNNKTTRATLNFAKQTQLVKVDTQKAKKKIDKDAIIKELNTLIETLRSEMDQKKKTILDLKKQMKSENNNNVTPKDVFPKQETDEKKVDNNTIGSVLHQRSATQGVFMKFEQLNRQLTDAAAEEAKWNINPELETINISNMSEDEMKQIFDEFDEDCGGSIDGQELQNALKKMGQELSMEEINELIVEIDEDENGEIDFNEFKVMATKTWFVDAFQSKLVANMTRMMTSMNLMDDDNDDDEFDDEKDINEEYEQLMENMKEKNEIIENMTNEINELKQNSDKKDIEQKNEIERLMNQINGFKKENNELNSAKNELDKLKKEMEGKLKSDMDGIKNENNELKVNIDRLVKENNELKQAQGEVDRLKKRIEILNDKQNDDINGIKKENEELNDNVSKLENEKNMIGNELIVLKKDYDKLKDIIDKLKKENEEFKSNNGGNNGINGNINNRNNNNLNVNGNAENNGNILNENSQNIDNEQIEQEQPQQTSFMFSMVRSVLEGLV